MTDTIVVNVANDFSRFPSGRTPHDSAFSGKSFRQKHLTPHLKLGKSVRVELDGPIGYGSSFLEEAFGGLVREDGFDLNTVRRRIELVSYDTALIDEIWSYLVAQ